jgi:hypothetical protein
MSTPTLGRSDLLNLNERRSEAGGDTDTIGSIAGQIELR